MNDIIIEDVVGSFVSVGTEMTAGEYAGSKGGKVWVDVIETSEGCSSSWCGTIEQAQQLIDALQAAIADASNR